jgi:hypothetical protein
LKTVGIPPHQFRFSPRLESSNLHTPGVIPLEKFHGRPSNGFLYDYCERKMRMPITSIIADIDAEIEKLELARVLLAGMAELTRETSAPAKKPAKRKLRAAARKKIAAAQRKRWAAAKKAVKTTPAKPEKKAAAPAKRRKLSAAARKRIADAQKKRWAAVKAEKAKKAAPVKKPAAKPKKAPAKKAAAAKKAAPKKAPAAKAKKAAPEKAIPAATEAAPA